MNERLTPSNSCSGPIRFFAVTFLLLIMASVGFGAENVASGATAEPRATDNQGARDRLAALRREVAHHDELYFKRAAPELTDAAYDQLKRELAALENALAPAEATTAPLGDDRTGLFPTYHHRQKMLSLDKSYSAEDLRSFRARVARQLRRDDLRFVVEPKFDGLSISVTYENGKLIRAVTRGNGVEGDDVTANALKIAGLPHELRGASGKGGRSALPVLVELRGEVYLPLAQFARLNLEREAAGEEPFAHPRNLAAGTLRQLDPAAVEERGLAVVFYGWGAWEPASQVPASQSELHERIRAWGLPGVANLRAGGGDLEIWAAVQALGRERSKLPYPIDGAVVKLDSVRDWETLGATEHAPLWATAFKFPADRVETKLLAITVQVGRTGVLTPVAELAPVRIGGTTITRASLHNRSEIVRHDFRVGDVVFVEKAGEIIPAVVGVNTARRPAESEPFVFPALCPSCRAAVVALADESAVRCENMDCPAQLQRRVMHFVSDAGVGIPGFGPALIEGLIARGRLKSVADLYRLRAEDFVGARGAPSKMAGRLLAAVQQSKQAELRRVIQGLGIPEVGAVASKELAREFGGLETLMETDAEDLVARGFTGKTVAAAAAYFAEPKHRALVLDLIALGLGRAPGAGGAHSISEISGRTFAFTGSLPGMSRRQATEKILSAGGKVVTDVSRRTDFVVAGEGSGAKLAAARALDVRVIDEEELRQMLGGK